jgi:hypothetical protein
MSHPDGVLAGIRDVLLEHMSNPEDWLPWTCVQRALVLGASGRILAEEEHCDGDPPTALLLTMADGSGVRVTVTQGVVEDR